MYPIVSRLTPVGCFYFLLALICVTVPFTVGTLEAEMLGNAWESGKEADALSSLFSNLEVEKLQSLLKNVPPAELQKIATRVLGDVNKNDNEQEKRNSILKAIKKEGLLDSWKEELNNMIFDDNSLPLESDNKAKEFQRNLKGKDKDPHEVKFDYVIYDYLLKIFINVFIQIDSLHLKTHCYRKVLLQNKLKTLLMKCCSIQNLTERHLLIRNK